MKDKKINKDDEIKRLKEHIKELEMVETQRNRAWLDTLGYKREEVINKCFDTFIDPDFYKFTRMSDRRID